MTDFHQRLRHLRTARKLTQTRVAELLGISPRVYTRWENGGATPLFDTVVRIADILGVSLDELAGRADSNGEPQIRNPELHRLCKK
jgi:transcriptional regulator with XRE-family HTH domain